ncbi:anaerobic ribonucleoside-triphosphate reductase activating protein [Candidatus Bathyarchaeota archaeon]|nr:anaerobic ribonucleoside-triphosphate reductase activating protein [Candidatus Bathyarchaeota archaeon]
MNGLHELGGPGMRIGGVVDMSTVDWYGNVSLVVFFAGCNLRCPYCQNSGLIPLNSGEEVDLDYLRGRILLNMTPVPELDSVVLTGGEPTLQAEAVLEVAGLARELGLKVMLDTNGSLPEAIEPLLEAGLVDRVALDLKAPLNARDYEEAAGASNAEDVVANVGRTLDLCAEYGVDVEARTTVAPTVTDSERFIRGIARDIRDRCAVYYLQQYDNTGEVLSPRLKQLPPPTKERLKELAEVALAEGLRNVYIKTREDGLERMG